MSILFRVVVASTHRSTSTEETKGENFLRCLRHVYRYIFFLALSAFCRNFSGGFAKWDLASVFTTWMSWTLSVPFYQRSWIRRSPLCFVVSSNGALYGMEVTVVLSGFSFGLFTTQPVKIRGLLRTLEGLNEFPDKSVTPLWRLLWRDVTSLPLLQ